MLAKYLMDQKSGRIHAVISFKEDREQINKIVDEISGVKTTHMPLIYFIH